MSDDKRGKSRENQRKAEALYDEWRRNALSKGVFWTREQQAYYYELACDRFFG